MVLQVFFLSVSALGSFTITGLLTQIACY